MSKQELIFDLLETTGLNWTVNKAPLFREDGTPTESFGLFRNDSGKWLGTVGHMYEVMQNHELAEMLIEAGNLVNLEFTRGGHLKGGKLVYLQTKLKDAVIGRDTLKRNLTALNSHDGSTSIGFGTTNTVVVCQNTFHMALRDKSISRFRHTMNAKEKIERLADSINRAVTGEESMVKQMERMAEVRITEEPFNRVMGVLFGEKNIGKDIEDMHPNTKSRANIFAEVLEKEVQSHGKTLWGLFNAVTYLTNHVEDVADRESYLMVGAGNEKNVKTFNTLWEYIAD